MTPRIDPRGDHGTAGRARAGCDCPPCAAALAAAEYAREYRKNGARGRRRTRSRRKLSGNRTHGCIATYVAGCGCADCTEAARLKRQQYAR